MTLSPDQTAALSTIESCAGPFFLTGPAGSGKSFVINLLRESPGVAVCAMTGTAAQLVRGKTLHSYLSISPKYGAVESKSVRQRLAMTRTLIVDEASMMSDILLGQVYSRFERLPKPPKLILIGDPLQLGPVPNRGQKVKPFYESPLWSSFKVIRLTQIHRQADPDFISALNDLRVGNLSDRVSGLIKSRLVECLPDCTQIYARKDKVLEVNEERLARLGGPEFKNDWDRVLWRRCSKSDEQDQRDFEEAAKWARFPRKLRLRNRARVCLLRNDKEGRWVNGSTGMFIEQSGGSLIVRLDRGATVYIDPVEEEVCDEFGEVQLVVRQYPLMLAWALTIHKSQGMTMDRLGVDLSGHFGAGMTYVSLSRCRTSGGLLLVGELSRLTVDPKALAICFGDVA